MTHTVCVYLGVMGSGLKVLRNISGKEIKPDISLAEWVDISHM